MKLILVIITTVLLFSCHSSTEQAWDVAAYYFPFDSLFEEKVYEYVLEKEGSEYVSHYWSYKSVIENNQKYLICKRYDPQFQLDQSIKEWILDDGVITQEYVFHIFDSVQQAYRTYENKISQNIVYPFKPTQDSAMAYRFVCEMKLPPHFLKAKLVRDRRFLHTSRLNVLGKERKVVFFESKDFYDIENENEGGFWNLEKETIETYAEGIGLVHQETRTKGESGIEVLRLSRVLGINEIR